MTKLRRIRIVLLDRTAYYNAPKWHALNDMLTKIGEDNLTLATIGTLTKLGFPLNAHI